MPSDNIKTGHDVPYLDQLHRVYRQLKLFLESTKDPIEYRDRYYFFYQSCWHLRDWIKNDPTIDQAVRDVLDKQVHAADSPLRVCSDLANGSKHLRLDRPKSGTGGREHHLNYTIYPGQNRESEVDSFVDDGFGKQIHAKDFARTCVAHWEKLLGGAGLKLE